MDSEICYSENYKVSKKEIRIEGQGVILHASDKGALERVSDLNGKALGHPAIFWLDEKQIVFDKDSFIIKTGISKVMERTIDGNEEAVLKYYSLEDGAGYTGWKVIDGKKYHFSNDSHYIFDGHQNIDGKIYYYEDKGEMKKGWQQIDGK